MGGGSMMVQAPPPPEVDYLLVRFFDFKAKIGKKYRYRVRVLMEDPNRPENSTRAPRDRALSDEVKVRIDAVKAEEAKQNRRVFYVYTDWSDPSEVVAVNRLNRTLAGQMASVQQAQIEKGGAMTFPTAEPSAKVMAIVWDQLHAVDVPIVTDAYRGSVLNFSMNVDVIHPVTMHFKKLEEFPITTNRLVMDFDGGAVLPVIERAKSGTGDDDDDDELDEGPQREPTEFLFMDEAGTMFVRSEFDDLVDFERYQVPAVEKKPERDSGGDMGDGGGGMDMGM